MNFFLSVFCNFEKNIKILFGSTGTQRYASRFWCTYLQPKMAVVADSRKSIAAFETNTNSLHHLRNYLTEELDEMVFSIDESHITFHFNYAFFIVKYQNQLQMIDTNFSR